jgi:hypothetical protein
MPKQYVEIPKGALMFGGVGENTKSRHNVKATQATIKELLKHGTPDWVRRPREYIQFAKESFAYDKEQSDSLVAAYKHDDQDILTNFKARYINPINTRVFIEKLRANGIKCFTIFAGQPFQVGLWVVMPTKQGGRPVYICYMQIPAMVEWSILNLDKHGLPAGEGYRGWRTVVAQLIKKGVLTEKKAHQIFGKPTEGIVSRRYRRSLHAIRNSVKREAAQDDFSQFS